MLKTSIVCVEPDTPENEYLEQLVELPNGLLTQVVIFIPPGHSAVTGIRVRYGLEYIVPYRDSQWIKGDGVTIVDYPMFYLPDYINNIIVEAYNNSQNYQHCFYLYFIVMPWSKPLEQMLKEIIDRLDQMIDNTNLLITKLFGKKR